MKKIIKVSSLFLAFAVLAVSFSACGSVKGSKYKNDKDSKLVVSFAKDGNVTLSYDGKEEAKGTYKIEKKTITVTYKAEGKEVTYKFTIQDNKKKKLKDENGNTWTKM